MYVCQEIVSAFFFALELGTHTIHFIDLSLGIGSQDTPYFKVHVDAGRRLTVQFQEDC